MSKITIILPVYNSEQYLKKTIDSVLRQSFSDFTLIIVDDCSTDGGKALLEEFAAKDSRIRLLLREENTGCSECRNAALALVETSHCLMIDSDDEIPADYVESILECLPEALNNGCDTIHWGYMSIHDDHPEKNRLVKPTLWPERVIKGDLLKKDFLGTNFVSYEDLYRWFSSGKGYFEEVHSRKDNSTVWRFMYDMEVIRKNHLSFFGRRGGDVVFNAKYLLCCKGVYSTDKPVYRYLIREGSILHAKFSMALKYPHMEWVEGIADYVPEEERTDFWHLFGGQHLLILMNTARGCVKAFLFRDGFSQWKEMAKKPLCKKYVRAFRLGKARFPYTFAIGLLKCRMYFLFYSALWLLCKMGKDLSPMD